MHQSVRVTIQGIEMGLEGGCEPINMELELQRALWNIRSYRTRHSTVVSAPRPFAAYGY